MTRHRPPLMTLVGGGRPLGGADLAIGLALSFLYVMLWALLTKGTILSWAGVLTFFLLGMPLGSITWGYVVRLVKRTLDYAVFAPRRAARAQQALDEFNDNLSKPATYPSSPPHSHPWPSPASSSPSPLSVPAREDTQPVTPISRPPAATAVRLQGIWKLRWSRSNQVDCRQATLQIAQAGNRFRAVLSCDGRMTTKMEGTVVGNRAGFVCWPYQLESFRRTPGTGRGTGKLELLHGGDILGSWCLGTGPTVTFQAARKSDLPAP
jgi:hypothetical protein